MFFDDYNQQFGYEDSRPIIPFPVPIPMNPPIPDFPFYPGEQPPQPHPYNPPIPQSQGNNMPPGPPPSYTPQMGSQSISSYAVSPGSIRPCLYRFVYIWLIGGRQFWAWLTYINRTTAAGFRWSPSRRRWVYFAVDLNSILYFECY